MNNKSTSDTEINDDDQINVLSLIARYLRSWKINAIIIALALLLGAGYIFIAPKRYLAKSSILLTEDSKGKGAGGMIDLESLGLSPTTNNIDNEIALLTSPDLMLQVVDNLELNYTYTVKDKLREIDIYKSSPYLAQFTNDSILEYLNVYLTISKQGEGYVFDGYTLKEGEKTHFSEKSPTLPFSIPMEGAFLIIRKNEQLSSIEYGDKEIYIKIENPIAVADDYAASLDISTVTKFASTLSLAIQVSNPQKGIALLTELTRMFNADNVHEKNKVALNTAMFINERIVEIGKELNEVERVVEEYKQNKGITDLSSEAQVYMGQAVANNDKLVQIETELKIVEMIEEFIKNPKNEESLIPNIGLTDPGLTAAISQYNESLMAASSVLSSASEENPAKVRLQKELAVLRQGIIELVKNAKSSVVISRNDIGRQVNITESKVHSLPALERGLMEKMRQQQIKETLYLFLLQKREESNITLASTADKAKIIIKPRSDSKPISPNKKMIIAAALVLGIIVSVLYVYVRYLLHNKIESQEDLDKLTNIPILASIIANTEDRNLVIDKDSTTPIAELFRYLRNNIEFVLGNQKNKVILVTSTVAGEGKTFVASNLACAYTLNYKKVLLVGMDVRNPQLANTLGISKQYGFTDYISGSRDTWKELLAKVSEYPNLDILQAGTIPPNPNELLKSERVKDFIEQAQKEYDVIILDTAPLGIISDTYALASFADFTLYVVRENVSLRSGMDFVNEQYASDRFSNMYLVLNDSNPENASHRYYGAKTYGYDNGK